MQTLYACPNVRTRDERREAEPAADEGVPRAGLRRGHLRARVPARRARGEARPRPARAAAPQPRRHRARRRAASTRARTCSSATGARSRTGSAATRCAPARPTPSSAASGMASQIWFGGGGPPSYAWIRVGSDGHAAVVTAGQDVGTGTKTALAQIAAEELGHPARARDRRGRRLRPRPVRDALGRLLDDPVDGAAVRAAAGDARRQILELAAQRYDARRRRALARAAARSCFRTGAASRSRRSSGCSATARSSARARAARTRPGCSVLTFGVQVAEVAVDVETGEVTVERVAAIHDVGRVINPLGASSQIEGGIIQGDRAHALRAAARPTRRPARILTRTLDAYRMPTIADVPEIVSELIDVPDDAADEPRLEGDRRAADHPDRRGDRERDPRRDRRRHPLAADHARGDARRALRGARRKAAGGARRA